MPAVIAEPTAGLVRDLRVTLQEYQQSDQFRCCCILEGPRPSAQQLQRAKQCVRRAMQCFELKTLLSDDEG